MPAIHEYVLILTLFLPPHTVHHKTVPTSPVTINELHRTYESCMARGREMHHKIKTRHKWSCHEVDQD